MSIALAEAECNPASCNILHRICISREQDRSEQWQLFEPREIAVQTYRRLRLLLLWATIVT